jgi:ABC-2 type transport system ATP-binding protein
MTGCPIETKGLTKEVVSQFLRKRTRILDGVDITVEQGQTFGLLGLNGAGKTTTIKLLLGLLKPTAGTASVLGQTAGSRDALQNIGFLPENPYFYSQLTARECLLFMASLFSVPKELARERTEKLLELVQMSASANQPMNKYSKGMLQRVGIAQSLINSPKVIFWDEPMSGLDIVGRRDVRQILHNLKEQGCTIFFNSHLLPDVSEICDTIGILHKGKLIAHEKMASISTQGNYKDLESYFLQCIGETDGEKIVDGAQRLPQ